MTSKPGVFDLAAAVLRAAAPDEKVAAARALRATWDSGCAPLNPQTPPPDRPGRPSAPDLVAPYRVKRRRLGTPAGRAALLHAVAHIEFNAIDLAADMIARFAGSPLLSDEERPDFISDWAGVCDDEARHFDLVRSRLSDFDMHYGDLPAHDGLWQAAEKTAGDFIARLVIAPMVLEARGLDVTPAMIAKLKAAGDEDSAAILQVIYDDEIGHVAAGRKWYAAVCKRDGKNETQTFHDKVRTYFQGLLKPPFNEEARDLAGMPTEFYLPLTEPAARSWDKSAHISL